MIWKYALLIKAVTAAKAAESPHLVWISLCFAQKSTTGRGFDAATKEAAELALQKTGHKRPLEMGTHL